MITGLDVSHWQGYMLWEKAKLAGASFGFFKGTDFTTITKQPFTDSQQLNNWKGTRDQGLINGMYGWIQPGVDPVVQAKYYCELFTKYPTDFAIGDFEDVNFQSASDMAWRGQVFFEYLRNNLPVPILLYTGKWYMDKFPRAKVEWASQYYLWHASYPTLSSWMYTTIYPIWKQWTIWQYTAKGDAVKYGATQAKSIDLNRYKGTIENLRTLADGNLPIITDPVIVPSVGSTFEVLGLEQYVRSGPGIGYEVRTTLKRGATLVNMKDVQVISADEIWLEFEIGWIALVYGGKLYLKDR